MERCSNCGHPFNATVCSECGREFCCGSAGIDCEREGCADRVMDPQYEGSLESDQWRLDKLPKEEPRRAA